MSITSILVPFILTGIIMAMAAILWGRYKASKPEQGSMSDSEAEQLGGEL